MVSTVCADVRCRIISGSGQTGVQRGLGAMYALDTGGRLGKVYNDGSKGGRSRRSVGARWGHGRRADDNTLLSGNLLVYSHFLVAFVLRL